MPGQQKQYSRAPIAYCSTVPAARARLSAGHRVPALLSAHCLSAAPDHPRSSPSGGALPRTTAVPRARGTSQREEERPKPPPTYLLPNWPMGAGAPQEHASSRTQPSNFPARGYSSASRFEPFKALQNMNCCCIPSESTKGGSLWGTCRWRKT